MLAPCNKGGVEELREDPIERVNVNTVASWMWLDVAAGSRRYPHQCVLTHDIQTQIYRVLFRYPCPTRTHIVGSGHDTRIRQVVFNF